MRPVDLPQQRERRHGLILLGFAAEAFGEHRQCQFPGFSLLVHQLFTDPAVRAAKLISMGDPLDDRLGLNVPYEWWPAPDAARRDRGGGLLLGAATGAAALGPGRHAELHPSRPGGRRRRLGHPAAAGPARARRPPRRIAGRRTARSPERSPTRPSAAPSRSSTTPRWWSTVAPLRTACWPSRGRWRPSPGPPSGSGSSSRSRTSRRSSRDRRRSRRTRSRSARSPAGSTRPRSRSASTSATPTSSPASAGPRCTG